MIQTLLDLRTYCEHHIVPTPSNEELYMIAEIFYVTELQKACLSGYLHSKENMEWAEVLKSYLLYSLTCLFYYQYLGEYIKQYRYLGKQGVQWVKVLATQPHDQNLMLKVHMIKV